MRVPCRYKFDCTYAHMVKNSPDLDFDMFLLRQQIVLMIAELSMSYDQKILDKEVLIDINSVTNEIIGLDLSRLLDSEYRVYMKNIKLGEMTSMNWITMKVID